MRSLDMPAYTRHKMSFQPRAGMSEGFSAERPRPPSVRARLLRRRRSEPDSSRPSGRWRSILHVSVSLFAIDVPHGVFGIRSRCSAVRIRAERAVLIPNEPLLRLVPHNRWLGRKKMAPPELREGPSSSAEVTTNWDLCPGADNPTLCTSRD